MCAIKLVQRESEMLSGLFGGTECLLLMCKSAGSHIAQHLQAQGHQKRLQLCPLTVLEATLDILNKTLCAFLYLLLTLLFFFGTWQPSKPILLVVINCCFFNDGVYTLQVFSMAQNTLWNRLLQSFML